MYENGSYRIRDTRHGDMLYSINDTFIGTCLDKYGEWCFDEIYATQYYCTENVIDIGANIGTHTLCYAQYAKQVYSFEPQPTCYNILCANIALNKLCNATALRAALGSTTGIVNIPSIPYEYTGNFGGVSIGTGEDITVIRTLDEYNFQDISLIKIDTEGSEMAILDGARETIRRCKPVLYIENDRKEKQDSVCKMVESLGYIWKWHYAMLFREENYRNCQENIFHNIAGINIICIPEGEEHAKEDDKENRRRVQEKRKVSRAGKENCLRNC